MSWVQLVKNNISSISLSAAASLVGANGSYSLVGKNISEIEQIEYIAKALQDRRMEAVQDLNANEPILKITAMLVGSIFLLGVASALEKQLQPIKQSGCIYLLCRPLFKISQFIRICMLVFILTAMMMLFLLRLPNMA